MLFTNKTILLVEDEDLLREAMAFELETEGAKVLLASGGHEALKLLETHHPHLILSDIRMPKGDGIELLSQIKKLPFPNTDIILLTGFTDLEIHEIYHKGASGIIHKPFEPEHFLSTVSRLMLPLEQRWKHKVGTNFQQNILSQTLLMKSDSLQKAIKDSLLTLGQGGMFIAFKENIPEVGTVIKFDLCFKDKKTLEISGIVRWRRSSSVGNIHSGIGIEFYAMNDNSIAIIKEILESIIDKTPYIPHK